MIDGIISQVGINEDPSDFVQKSPPTDDSRPRGFDRVLTKAQDRPPHREPPARQADESARHDSIAREDGAAPAHSRDKPAATGGGEEKIAASREKSSGEEDTRSAAESVQDSNRRAPIQTASTEEPLTQAETALLVPGETALEFTEDGALPATETKPAQNTETDITANTAETAAAIQAAPFSAMGMTAYRNSAHGVGEQEAAANNGLSLQPHPGTAAQASIEAKAQDVLAAAAFDRSDPDPLPESNNLRKPAADYFELNLKPNAEPPTEESEAARRSEVLAAIRQPVEGDGSGSPAAVKGSSLGLAGRMFLDARQLDSKDRDIGAAGPKDINTASEIKPTDLTAASSPSIADKAAVGSLGQTERAEQATIARVVQDVKWLLRNNQNEVTIRLHPENLGAMRLKVVQTDGGLRVEMTVDNQQARILLESRIDELRQQLSQENVDVDRFTVNVNVREGDNWDGARQTAQTPVDTAYPDWLREPGTGEEPIVPQAERPIWGRSGVGIYA